MALAGDGLARRAEAATLTFDRAVRERLIPCTPEIVPDSGVILPDMGRTSVPRKGLADALFTSVQQRVLGLLFGPPERRFQSGELIRLADSGTGVLHRQLARSVNPTILTPADWRLRRTEPDSFASRIATQPRIFVIGGDDDLR